MFYRKQSLGVLCFTIMTQTSISLLTASRFVDMAENSASVAKMARLLAINQILIGFLLFSFGIADRLVLEALLATRILEFGSEYG